MPIGRDEYELGEVDLSLYVLQCLRAQSDYAFTEDELLSALASSPRTSTREELVKALEALVESRKVESKTLKGIVYYRYCKRPLGFTLR